MSNTQTDLNEVITSAVQARIESTIATELSSSDIYGKCVAAALTRPIEVGSYSDKRKTTFLRETLEGAIREAAKDAIGVVMESERENIEKLVATQLRRNVKVFAETLTDNAITAAKSKYGVKVDFIVKKDEW